MKNAIHIYVYRYVRYQIICGAVNECHVYVMWVERDHSHLLYVLVISNVVTNGNGTGTKNVLRNHALGFVFSIQSSVYDAIIVAEITTYSLPRYGLL